jgi:hypothetical protein
MSYTPTDFSTTAVIDNSTPFSQFKTELADKLMVDVENYLTSEFTNIGSILGGSAGYGTNIVDQNASNTSLGNFEARARIVRSLTRGSGFIRWEKLTNSGYDQINKSMYTKSHTSLSSGNANLLYTDLSNNSLVNIDGYLISVLGVNSTNISNIIHLPPAPMPSIETSLNTANSYTQGDFAILNTTSIEYVTNGDFSNGTTGWIDDGTNSSSIVGGALNVDVSTINTKTYQALSLVNGKKYVLEFDAYYSSGSDGYVDIVAGSFGSIPSNDGSDKRIELSDTSSHYKVEITSDNVDYFVAISSASVSTIVIDNVSVKPSDKVYVCVAEASAGEDLQDTTYFEPRKQVSRVDLAFLEVWKEDISDKDFVYPYGNIQYRGSDIDGLSSIANGLFSGADTYSLFGAWSSANDIVGKGYIWSNLSDSDKEILLKNPLNNIFIDGNNYLQLRYRMRAVKGIGDEWERVQDIDVYNFQYNGARQVAKRGSTTSHTPSTGDLATSSNLWFVDSIYSGKQKGVFYNIASNTYALPIALVQRRNQGLYHPVYNPLGTAKASDDKYWYDTSVSFTSIVDCFTVSKLQSGDINTSKSGRPDDLYYDEINERDITDLRLDAKKTPNLDKAQQDLISGQLRGQEGEWRTQKYTTALMQSVLTTSTIDGTGAYLIAENLGSDIVYIPDELNNSGTYTLFNETKTYIKDDDGKFIRVARYTGYDSVATTNTLGNDENASPSYGSFTQSNSYDFYISYKTTAKSNNTLLHCDIIGDPDNYPQSWKDNGVAGIPLLVGENGEDYLPNGARDTWKLSKKADSILLALRSTDNGSTWTSFTPTFTASSNTLTLTDEPINNLVMVFYETKAKLIDYANNDNILDNQLSRVYGTMRDWANHNISHHLINKVQTLTSSTPSTLFVDIPHSYTNITETSGVNTSLNTSSDYAPTHNTINLNGQDIPAIKLFCYKTVENNLEYLNIVFKEMKYDTTWGDDDKFQIVDNMGAQSDDNGNIVLYGTARYKFPLGFAKEIE